MKRRMRPATRCPGRWPRAPAERPSAWRRREAATEIEVKSWPACLGSTATPEMAVPGAENRRGVAFPRPRSLWLPRLDRSRTTRLLPMRVVVPWDRVALGLELPVLPGKPLPNPVVRARELQAALDEHGTAAGVARAFGITRASVCQYLTILRRLPPEVLVAVEREKDQVKLKSMSLRHLLGLAMTGGASGRARRPTCRSGRR